MLWNMSASEMVAAVVTGKVSAADIVKSCLDRIEETDGPIGAWLHVDGEGALKDAEEMDWIRKKGRPVGTLHGVPIGIKDIFDVAGMPTTFGAAGGSQALCEVDSAIVAKLREAGAIILGKTKTTPFACGAFIDGGNPHNTDHHPGGSSVGSAAAVAAGHVPLAIGTQTNGSTIRPASYCGVVGMKPSRGLISRSGCLTTSKSLDQVGVLAREIEDVARLSEALVGFDAGDSATHTRPKPNLVAGYHSEPPVEPTFAYFDLPYKDRMAPETIEGLEELVEALGARVDRIEAPQTFQDAIDALATIHNVEFTRNIEGMDALPSDLPPAIAKMFDAAHATDEARYKHALAMLAGTVSYFESFFNDYDAIIAPAALGIAPLRTEGTTGDAICCTIWQLAGLPCLSLPWLSGQKDLPIGVQLIGGLEEDARLMRTAHWLENHLNQETLG